LSPFYDIQILPAEAANTLGDRALVAALAERAPWMVGFTCYVWNIERTLWIARELKRLRPTVRIVLGGPEITADNAWVLQTAEEERLLLETTRGCVFKCKFCYYPKSYDKQYYLAAEQVRANLRHAQERGVREVFLLDPTLNQRPDFADFLRVLAQGNPGRR